jgi:hypothetical protein
MSTPYPKIGSIVVSKDGEALIHVWPCEQNIAHCFTGVSLFSGDSSCMWLRSHFEADNIFKRPLLSRYRKTRRKLRKGKGRA